MNYLVFVLVALVLMALDIVSGLAQAFKNHNYMSEKMRVGLWHKTSYLLIIFLAFFLEWALNYIDIGITVPLIVPICSYIVLNELGSIIENLSLLNENLVPAKLRELFGIKKGEE